MSSLKYKYRHFTFYGCRILWDDKGKLVWMLGLVFRSV
jgi:hypothetical protein